MGAFDDLVPKGVPTAVANPFADLVPRQVPLSTFGVISTPSTTQKLLLDHPKLQQALTGINSLFSPSDDRGNLFRNVNPNPATVPQALASLGKSTVNSLASPGGFGLMTMGPIGEELNPAVRQSLAKLIGLAFAPQAAKMVGEGLGKASVSQTPTPERVMGVGEAAQGGLMSLGAVAPHLIPEQVPSIPEYLQPKPNRELTLDERNARVQVLRSANPTPPPPESVPKVTTKNIDAPQLPQTKVSTTSNLGMLDQEFRHKVQNTMAVINGYEQSGVFQPQEASALRGQLKLIGLKANEGGQDLKPMVEQLQQRAADVGRYRYLANRFSKLQDNPEKLQPVWSEIEQLKNKNGGMPPTLGELNETATNGKKVQEIQTLPKGENAVKIQAAPQREVPGSGQGQNGTGVAGDVKGNGVLEKGGQNAKYPLSTSVHEGKMVDAEGRTVDAKTHKTTGESGFVIAPKEMWDKVWSNKTTKIDPQQMFNRLKNVMGEGSALFQHLQSVGLGQFLQGGEKKSTEDVERWAEENGPKVEVRKFGEGGQKPLNQEYNRLSHEWYDGLSQRQRELIDKHWQRLLNDTPEKFEQALLSEGFTTASATKGRRYKELGDQLRSSPSSENESHWSSIAPKSEKDMPGYVEIAVVKPFKDFDIKRQNQEDQFSSENREVPYQFPSSHNFPPNTLGFVRGYMENVGGKKVFHVIEVQSDWAQARRADESRSNSQVRGTPTDPLLPHYERLALKAAIDHARSEGADAIAISDAETAMMTEGHDRGFEPEGDLSGESYSNKKMAEETAKRLTERTGTLHEIYDEDPAAGGMWRVRSTGKGEPKQQEGMRLHYDQTLPKIAGELTGSKGERVSLGDHKQTIVDNRRYEHPEILDNRPAEQKYRKDLIFRNPDGTPKTDVSTRLFPIDKAAKEFSLYGRTGSIFPESPAAKMFKEAGGVEVQPRIVTEALDKLDSLKSTAKNIYDAVTDSHTWKSTWLKRQGYDLPKIEAISPSLANSVAKYANSQPAAALRAQAEVSKVLGDKAKDEQFRKQLGGIIYEDMRRASGGVGTSVFDLKNSPFTNEAQYRAALNNPAMRTALDKWKQTIQPLATEMHEKLGGALAESGKETGAFANLIAVLEDKEQAPVENSPIGVGPLSTIKKGSAFNRERKFSGQEYNLDAKDMAVRMLTKNASEFNKRLVYDELEKSGQGKLIGSKANAPQGMVVLENPVSLRSIVIKNADGTTSTANVNKWLAVNPKIASEIKQAFQLNTNWKEWTKENHPLLHNLSQVVIKTQVGLGIDLGFHTFNDAISVANSPKGLLALPKKTLEVAKASQDIIAQNPKVQEELAKMAEAGISFRGDSLGGWSSHALKFADTVTRLVLNREYDRLVQEGTVVDSAAERRRYINGRAGQYNKRFMTWFQQGMQETGMGAFNVAGRNFNRLAVGNLTFSPGVKAKTNLDAFRLRLSIAAGLATAAVIVPAIVNKEETGEYQPLGTEIGDMVIPKALGGGKNPNGSYKVLNMRKATMLARGGRVSGLGDVMNEQVLPRLRGQQPASMGQTTYDAAKDIGRTAVAPFSGPPLNALSVGFTGKTEGGLGYEQRTPGEKPPYVAAMLGQLNPLVGPVAVNKDTGNLLSRVGKRIGSIVGIQDSQSPFSIIRNRAAMYKQSNNIHTDESSFAPSEYIPLKNALLNGDMDTAKAAYQQLLHEKSQRGDLSDEQALNDAKVSIQKEFSKMENFKFVNKESEDKFKASLTPQQRAMYDNAVQQQKEVAKKFFNEIQGKIDGKPKGFSLPKLNSLKPLTKLDETNPEHRAIAMRLLQQANGNPQVATELAKQQGFEV